MRALAPILVSLALLAAGCGAINPPNIAIAPMAAEVGTRVERPDRPPIRLLDCDGDGLVSHDELSAGFTLKREAVSADEFRAADLSRDGKWNEAEFARFLNHRELRSWSVHRPCPAGAGRRLYVNGQGT